MIDIGALAFDADAMLAGLKSWVECESPTHDAEAVGRMMDLASRDLALMGATIERIPGRMGFGDCVRARLPHAGPAKPGILILGHMDTVHPVGTLASLPFRQDGAYCYGPGICDMKGGNYLALEAVRQLAKAGIETPLPITVLFTSDEEVGSPSTRDLIEAEAARHAYILVPEPAHAIDLAITGRYAIARFDLEAKGTPSHAGAALKAGRSAIREMARRTLEIEAMTTEDCTFSVGVVQGGQWVNCVASSCRGQALSMAKRQHDLDHGVEKMLALSGETGEVPFYVRRGVTRPVWEPDAGTDALFALAVGLSKQQGIELKPHSAGGGSDGNFTGAMGIPTLDGLGVHGDGIHTLQERIEIATLATRGRLMAGLLASLGA